MSTLSWSVSSAKPHSDSIPDQRTFNHASTAGGDDAAVVATAGGDAAIVATTTGGDTSGDITRVLPRSPPPPPLPSALFSSHHATSIAIRHVLASTADADGPTSTASDPTRPYLPTTVLDSSESLAGSALDSSRSLAGSKRTLDFDCGLSDGQSPPLERSSAPLEKHTKRQPKRIRAAVNRGVRAEHSANGTSHHLLPEPQRKRRARREEISGSESRWPSSVRAFPPRAALHLH